MAKAKGATRPPSDFVRVRRLPERGAYDRQAIHDVLDAARHATVAHVIQGRPVATPTLHWRVGERVYWHGSVASRMLKSHAEPGVVCLTAMVMDGWVLARSAFNHTVNYRSVMCFGVPEAVTDAAEKSELLRHFMEHWFPGRWDALRPVTKRELNATGLYSIGLDEASAKIRAGGAEDPLKDQDWPVWAGVVPVAERLGTPQPSAGVPADCRVPAMPRLRAKRRS